MFLTRAERDYLLSGGGPQINGTYRRVIKSRLQKKIERFVSEELPLLIDKGFIQSSSSSTTMLDLHAGVTGSCNVTGNCNAREKKNSKNGIKHAQNSERIAPGFIHAPWSGGE